MTEVTEGHAEEILLSSGHEPGSITDCILIKLFKFEPGEMQIVK